MKLNPKAKLTRNLFSKKVELQATRDGYGAGLLSAGGKNEKVVVLAADVAESTRSHWFAKKFPKRFIEVGVAEQNLAGVAAGLALEGFIPFISSYAVFSPGRNWEQIRVSICYTNANVKIAGHHAGLSTGPDGATHQALEDIALTRVLPNMTVVVPADALEAKKAVIALSRHRGPAYIRLFRPATPVFTTPATPFVLGRAQALTQGRDVTIIACGPLVYKALQAAEILGKKYKIKAEVINCHTIKPLDKKTILQSVKKTGAVVCAEEHQQAGGLGSAVAEYLGQHYPVPMRFVAVADSFGESGEAEELLKKYGLTVERIVKSALEAIKMKR